MSDQHQSRVPAGVTTGGQFSTTARAEAHVTLAATPARDEIRGPAHKDEDPTWASGTLAPRDELGLTRPDAVPFDDDPSSVEDAIASVQTSHLASARADHAAARTVTGWQAWATEQARAQVPGSPAAQRYADFEAGIRHGVMALYSGTAEVREDYVVTRLQRELGGAPVNSTFHTVRREMTSKRTSKASRAEWAQSVRTAPTEAMRRGILTAGLALSGQDGWWGMRADPEATVGR
ncbi:hypothetical protein [Cellulosimicrobium sp. Marseille-Q4280]|uniref:hypothetical protein n=1 Tax=Cellulosimicrobium sp. Marseille-Q4280 TaxID=2937992 RepID=UPI00203F73EE|nr:hypothetical protein [Cellulosimicrobium sp. Marseille-Q4280]